LRHGGRRTKGGQKGSGSQYFHFHFHFRFRINR
jgi:hypothetical protein